MTDAPHETSQQTTQECSLNDVQDKGKEKYSVLTSHDEGYQELILTSDAMSEDDLDDEEEWRATSDIDEDEDDISEEEEMVIECPFGDVPQGALLDLSHAEAPLESPRRPRQTRREIPNPHLDVANLEPVSLGNILPPGSRRQRKPQ